MYFKLNIKNQIKNEKYNNKNIKIVPLTISENIWTSFFFDVQIYKVKDMW